MGKTIILVHGRNFKPPKNELRKIWIQALRHGIERDHRNKLIRFDAVPKEIIYYGDLTNKILKNKLKEPVPTDIAARKESLKMLMQYNSGQFTKKNYQSMPGFNSFKEAFADTVGAVLGSLHLAEPLIEAMSPDVKEYWNPDSEYGSEVRYRMIEPLKKAMNRNDRILVIAHSLGSIIAYDTFWKFSRLSEYRSGYAKKKIDLWMTMGSPLGDETVKRNLRGSQARRQRRYPGNIKRWINVAAEDDYISHDQKIVNDYKDMYKFNLIQSIADKRIYNLTVKNGVLNQHASVGYLIHPFVAETVANWL